MMRHRKVVLLLAGLLASCVSSEDKGRHDMMDAIEAGLRMPRRAASFDKYARYYARAPDGSIIGLITVPLNAGDPKAWDNLEAGQRRWISDYLLIEAVFDGGCAVMRVRYDPYTRERAGPICQSEPSD
jgi:hypothetical protein